MINSVFPAPVTNTNGTVVLQDIKHLINRLLEECSKQSSLYARWSIELHGVFTNYGHKINVVSRNGNIYTVSAPLESGNVIWNRLNQSIENFKNTDSQSRIIFLQNNPNNVYHSLFLKNFDTVIYM